LTAILAEFYLKHSPRDNVRNTLKKLKSYKRIDLCSGKPYKWNKKKKLLYGIGTDLIDNSGKENHSSRLNADFSIPVVLKIELEKREKTK